MYSPGCKDMGVVVKLEERTLVVVGVADVAGVALAGHGGVNTVKEPSQTQLIIPPLPRRHQTLHNEQVSL